ncbi:NAD+ synthase [Gemmatimonadota bacterium]
MTGTLPPIETGSVLPRIESFLVDALAQPGLRNGIVGLSGGIDSAVAAALLVRAVGSERARFIYMPHAISSRENAEDARDAAALLGVDLIEVPITGMTGGYPGFDQLDNIRAGNLMARMRMAILYDLSVEHEALVIGTSNRTEILLGYGTLFGDTACAVNPIGDLYKTWLRELAVVLGIPESIRLKAPSADLWVGQTDEDELGVDYATADRILYHLVEEELPADRIAAIGFDADLVNGIRERMERNAYKRRLPEICRLFGEPDVPR